MGKFSKGFLFGSLLAGGITLLTKKHPGSYYREKTIDSISDTANEVHRLTTSIAALKQEVAALTDEILPQTQAIVDELQEEITEFTYQNQPRLNRIKWHLNKLQQDATKQKGE